MQASFTPQEEDIIDRLRDKYSVLRDGMAAAAEVDTSCVSCSVGVQSARAGEPPSSSSRRATSNMEASVCHYCHGTGTLVELYNHRRLENFCKECDGRGVRVFKNGVEVQPGAAVAAVARTRGGEGGQLTSSRVAGPAGVVAMHSNSKTGNAADGSAASGSSSDGDGDNSEESGERITALQRDLKRIAAKAASYTKERMDVLVLLQQPQAAGGAAAADPEGRERAVRDLVAQLDLQLERLELARRKKQAALNKLGAMT